MLKEKYINILLAAGLVIAAVVRFPCDDLRLSMRLLFEIFVTISFAAYVWKINKWMALFLMLSMISMLFPFYTRDSYLSFLAVFFGVVTYVVIVQMFNIETIKYLYNAMGVIALISVFYLVIQYFGYKYMFITEYRAVLSQVPTALMGNQNLASALLAFCFPAFMRKTWYWFIPLIVLGLIISQTTAGVVAIGAGLAVYFIATGFPFLTLIPIAFFIIYIVFIDTFNSVEERLSAWKFAMNLYKQHWIMGSGIGHWKVLGSIKRPELNNLGWLALHNEFLQALFEMGIGFIAILGGYFYDIYKRMSIKALIPLMALTIICANSMFNFPFHIGTTAMLGVVWFAILEIHLKNECSQNEHKVKYGSSKKA